MDNRGTYDDCRSSWVRQHKIGRLPQIEMGDLELAPFYERGGPVKAYRLFGPGLGGMLEELNEALAG